MALALLQFEEGDAIGAENSLREAREEFRKEGIGDDEILADMLLTRVLLSQGKLADAQKEISAVSRSSGQEPGFFGSSEGVDCGTRRCKQPPGDPGTRFGFSRTPSPAPRSLDMWDFSWKRSLPWAKWRSRSGKVTAGLSLLADVRKQAQLRGFGLIANKAAALASAKSATAPRQNSRHSGKWRLIFEIWFPLRPNVSRGNSSRCAVTVHTAQTGYWICKRRRKVKLYADCSARRTSLSSPEARLTRPFMNLPTLFLPLILGPKLRTEVARPKFALSTLTEVSLSCRLASPASAPAGLADTTLPLTRAPAAITV